MIMKLTCPTSEGQISNTQMSSIAQQNDAFPKQTPLGMAYVPFQSWEKPFDCKEGFRKGTVFPSLDFPFLGREEAQGNDCKG